MGTGNSQIFSYSKVASKFGDNKREVSPIDGMT